MVVGPGGDFAAFRGVGVGEDLRRSESLCGSFGLFDNERLVFPKESQATKIKDLGFIFGEITVEEEIARGSQSSELTSVIQRGCDSVWREAWHGRIRQIDQKLIKIGTPVE
ncbi:hypothetical protein U1Q18_019927 [Sarracenia purpurea var. burkii]